MLLERSSGLGTQIPKLPLDPHENLLVTTASPIKHSPGIAAAHKQELRPGENHGISKKILKKKNLSS